MLARRNAFLATLAAGLGLVGASLVGMTNMDDQLRVAAAPTPDHIGDPCPDVRPPGV